MSYLDETADAIRAEVPPAVLPDGDTTLLFRLYALLARAKGEAVTAEDVHDAWAVWMQSREPDHRSIRPFAELPQDVRGSDDVYVRAIRAAARRSGALGDRTDRSG